MYLGISKRYYVTYLFQANCFEFDAVDGVAASGNRSEADYRSGTKTIKLFYHYIKQHLNELHFS